MFNIKLILFSLAVGGIMFLTWDYFNLRAEKYRLDNELKAANSTIKALDSKIDAEMEIVKRETSLIRGIHNAPETENGPVASVLRRAIDGL